MSETDTIAAVASAAGRGAIGVIRVSGPAVPALAVALFNCLPAPRRARRACFLDADGGVLDEGLALYFPAPASFTGENVLEFQGHGGAVVMDLLVQRLLTLGCRLARPGEFTERAFLNGKMDLTRAEAIADLIDAGTVAAARAAVRSLQGEFATRIAALQAQLTGLRTYVEAAIDFPEEEIDFLSDSSLTGRLSEVFAAFSSIIEAAQRGAMLRDGLRTVIAGKPNAGKSSLLNALVGDDVAIVTDIAGTTRDVLRHAVRLAGIAVEFSDTAGLRDAVDPIEAEGVRRARQEISLADQLLYVLDATLSNENTTPQLAALAKGFPQVRSIIFVMNKIDLLDAVPRVEVRDSFTTIYVSVKENLGIDVLRQHITALANARGNDAGVFTARRRHLDALRRALEHARAAADGLVQTRALELFAEDLRLSQQCLAEITGEFTNEHLLSEIFGNFCVGK